MIALTLEYTNAGGDHVFHALPIFKSVADCSWWAEWFARMLSSDHATSISTACEVAK